MERNLKYKAQLFFLNCLLLFNLKVNLLQPYLLEPSKTYMLFKEPPIIRK